MNEELKRYNSSSPWVAVVILKNMAAYDLSIYNGAMFYLWKKYQTEWNVQDSRLFYYLIRD